MTIAAGSPPPQPPYDVAVIKGGNGNLIRARTLPNNTLEVSTATPGDTITWSATTITQNARAGSGIALYVATSTVDVYWMARDGITIRRAQSADDAETWAAAESVGTLSTQVRGDYVFLTAPDANLVIATNNEADGTSLKVFFYDTGAWQTAVSWDYGTQRIGVYEPVITPFGSQYYSPISAIKLATGDYVFCFYGDSPRAYDDIGLYTMRVRNCIYGQTIHWGEIRPIFVTNPAQITSTAIIKKPTLFIAFPKIQIVGSEYWITALEESSFANTSIAHLAYWRSADGIHWSDRQYLAGTDLNYIPTADFLHSDILFGQIVAF